MTTVLEPTEANVQRAAAAIAAGKVIVAPSDTNLGLTLDPTQPSAVERAYEIKDRPRHKPLTLFVRDPAAWHEFATHQHPALVEDVVDEFWPGPLNLVLPATEAVPHEQCMRSGTVSIGCLSNPVWRSLAAAVDGPLAMTSANQSGTVEDSTLVDVDLATEHVGEEVELILAGNAQGTTRASTILDLAADDPTIRRRGDVTAGDLAGAGISIETV